jgi:hypothetical protein
MILKYLETGASLTPIEALQTMGVFRLAARIEELRKKGHNILTENVKKNGKEFARYTLVKRKEA